MNEWVDGGLDGWIDEFFFVHYITRTTELILHLLN